MSSLRAWARLFSGISVRISFTCWLVTLLTLALYAGLNLPQQKQDLLDALRSKARGVSSSLQDVTAGAAMSEDYSTVVDHCTQVLRGDEAIEYLVISRADGFSVIIDRNGWRTEILDRTWRPLKHEEVAEIAYTALVKRRVFRYMRPFEYSGIHWGWVNVGLSTTAYDRSLSAVYQRSAALAVLGAALSLMISLRQARRLVRPILNLRGVVGQVSKGDLSARAETGGGDEVDSLARSFNRMADTILARNRVLESVRFAGQQLLSAADWTTIVDDVLAKIGQAANVSRVYIFENRHQPDGSIVSSERYEWVAPGIPSTRHLWQAFRWQGSGLEQWAQQLAAARIVVADFQRGDKGTDEFDSSLRTLVSVPIQVGELWWGFLAVDECVRDHQWSDAEKDSFHAVADMIGAAIAGQRANRALREANETLELRVLERTRELKEEVQAKEAAYAQLAEAQQRAIDLSRQAGMAEVATSVLHNVGNVLNSVNVSASIVAGKAKESRVENLLALAQMLERHASDLPDFLTHDAKGQRAIPYLVKLSKHLQEERQITLREAALLTHHVGHIKEIVARQQSYAKASGLIELISLSELVEDTIQIVRTGIERHGIQLACEFEDIPRVPLDKHSVLQILLNLLRNAIQAIKEGANPEKRIVIRVNRCDPNRYRIAVSDTGIGLPPENLTRIFSHGFTTRQDGHGFGLHSGANAARQMGGTLRAESDGPGLGATFTLELPINAQQTLKGVSSR
ncbi:MAG: HAMP domain-containing protein [Bryobacterales bacterium]|nr:HAMP domain-containing protein [Bryobacterales bacterium]